MGIQRLYLCLLVASLSSCAVLNYNNDLALTRDIQPASILDLQSVELAEVPAAKQKPKPSRASISASELLSFTRARAIAPL